MGAHRPGRGTPGRLDLLARAGLPVPEGVIITGEAHEELLRVSSLGRHILRAASSAGGDGSRQRAISLRSSHERAPLGDALKSTVCEALIELRARSVCVISEYGGQGGLQSIPEVVDAVRALWLSAEGLQWQIRASADGAEIPSWPVLVQREIRPERIRWTAAEGATPEPGRAAASLRELSLRAQAVLGEPARIEWGLADGEWYILDVRPAGAKGALPSSMRHTLHPAAGSAERERRPGEPEQAVADRLAAYVETIGLQECAGILGESSVSLASLVDTDEQSRVHGGERRTFEEVIRRWTLEVLFMEDGRE